LLRDKGWEAWSILQDERQEKGYTYSEANSIADIE
jgi:hypothetical protein